MQSLNAAIAQRSHYSRRQAGELLKAGRVLVNGQPAQIGNKVHEGDEIQVDGEVLTQQSLMYLAFNKPIGYECSRQPHGSHPSVYDLLPKQYQTLQYAGRLDVESRGLLIFTNDGQWIQRLTHPSNKVERIYQVTLANDLTPDAAENVKNGVELQDGPSRLRLRGDGTTWTVSLHEGRKHQVRRTFAAIGNEVVDLVRIKHGAIKLGALEEGEYSLLKKPV